GQRRSLATADHQAGARPHSWDDSVWLSMGKGGATGNAAPAVRRVPHPLSRTTLNGLHQIKRPRSLKPQLAAHRPRPLERSSKMSLSSLVSQDQTEPQVKSACPSVLHFRSVQKP